MKEAMRMRYILLHSDDDSTGEGTEDEIDWCFYACEDQCLNETHSDNLAECCFNNCTNYCSTNVTSTDYDDNPIVSLPAKIIVTAILLIVCLASVITNGLTLYVFARYRKPFTPITACVVSLALSDLITTLTIGPAEASMFMMDLQWLLGKSYCRTSGFFQCMAVFASCATLCYIAVERHYSVLHPLLPRLPPYRVGIVVGGNWFVALCIGLPTAFMYHVKELPRCDDSLWKVCYTSETFTPETRQTYFLCIFLLAFLPLLLLILSIYAHLAHHLWVRRSIGNASQIGSIPQVRRKKRIVKTLIILTVMFIVCRTPIHIYSTVREFVPMQTTPLQQILRLFLITLNLCNAAANPLLYSLFHEHLRRLLVNPVKRIARAVNPKKKAIGVWTSSDNGLDSPRTLQSPEVKRIQFRLVPRPPEISGNYGK